MILVLCKYQRIQYLQMINEYQQTLFESSVLYPYQSYKLFCVYTIQAKLSLFSYLFLYIHIYVDKVIIYF